MCGEDELATAHQRGHGDGNGRGRSKKNGRLRLNSNTVHKSILECYDMSVLVPTCTAQKFDQYTY